MCHVADKFYGAVLTLTADGPAKQRLISAYVNNLEMLSEAEVPEAIQPRFEALRQAMNAIAPTEKETAVQVSVRKMSQADAARFTRSILLMFADLVRVKTTGERLNAGVGVRYSMFKRAEDSVRPPTVLAG